MVNVKDLCLFFPMLTPAICQQTAKQQTTRNTTKICLLAKWEELFHLAAVVPNRHCKGS